MTVAIPARDEAAYVVRALEALARQVGFDGRPLGGGLFDVVVFANNCRDDTANAVRRFASHSPQMATYVIESDLPPHAAHVGMARRAVLDWSARRFSDEGRNDGILASTDADTVVAPDWVAWTLREMVGVDAVAGFVDIDVFERQRLMAPVRLLYARERAYRRALAELEAVLDPQPEDPLPRHASFVGASFAVTTRAYLAGGGLPPLAALEDLAFCAALRRIDARVRHSMHVRATTSARRQTHVHDGFGAFIATLHERADHLQSVTVVHAERSIGQITARAALRRLWRGARDAGDIASVSAILGAPAQAWQPLLARNVPFGRVYERIIDRVAGRRAVYPSQSVEEATIALCNACASAKAAMPMRTTAASGAG
ncbi:MAG: glycosyltransferase family 2 protein [Candidatus Eremiobacteraeota bacterium]|nr:glycosyltransferase family 2 protein [Candidatus Eremiobacteraeota bacterium]MBC5822267.1 glycosyltransferase family 2 protein [Candidatus Eremiobacteraeota bacterium]